ncbi:H-NS family nucleoid-associated regulatory protein [Cupriavidus sp. UYPR2.512]|uniref:H-NS family nucleoid-associated regulatory protein n=1 Tax=Cupriavidus sp. UYPR2.512 TaxID=1080187 RepID=UPI00035F2F48|nr:H-NS family nucleoid-associated regulatory protein [Cupriavidus sp. UYPR2.512]UIF88064.1 H-NS histone family protein [Cupriavidus necator]UIF88929.1 H-NS histone family protein [Cupriavidus necator]
MKENELAPEQVVEPLVPSNATDGLGQKELPLAEAMRDADPVMGEASDACAGSGSVDTQTRRLDFWSTSRDSGPTATVSYRRRRPYAAPDASTEDVAPEASREAAASEALTESDAPEAPIEAMPSEATTEAVAEAPVEVLATDEPMEAAAQDELTETAAPVAPLYVPAPEAAPEETRAAKRGRKPKTRAEVAAPEVTTQATPTRKRGPKQITLRGVEAAPEAPTQKTRTRKPRQEQKAPTATQRPSQSSLLAQLASVNAQLEQWRATEVPKVVEEIRQWMQEYDLSIEDIAGKPSVEPAARAVPSKTKAAPPPRYRNPKTGQTWSGRGRAPAWIGKKPERFLIDLLS